MQRLRNLMAVCRPRQAIHTGATVLILLTITAGPSAAAAAAQTATGSRAQTFATAAQEFGVPRQLLLSVSYNESRWTPHGTQASSDNGFGIMDLRTKTVARSSDGRGDPARPAPTQTTVHATHYTLDDAAQLLGASPNTLKTDERQNIRGAAAVLASYARGQHQGQLPAALTDWYDAVAAYSGAIDQTSAQAFANDVFTSMQQGVSLATPDGQQLSIPATPQAAGVPHSTALLSSGVDCPPTISCRFVPAGYAANSSDPSDYGNWDPANRPHDMQIKYIVIHDTEGSYQSAIDHFQDTTSYVSAHYVIRSSDGAVTEMVRPKDVSWGAGDWYVNMHAINIEHEGFATQGSIWYTEAMYQSSAKLVRYLAAKYGIPLDRQHILGHDNIPTISPSRQAGQHWDPGPYWDWNHYMSLLQAPITSGSSVTPSSQLLTISPNFSANQQPIVDCSSGTCQTLPAQGSNLVYLHTEPRADAPLLTNTYLHTDGSPGTTHIEDWSATANAGDQFAVAGMMGDWTAIWYNGTVGWFYNPAGSARTAHVSHGRAIRPKAGLASISVYGQAFPEAAAYPSDIPAQSIVPLYAMSSGQTYVTSGTPPTDYFYDATINYSLPDDHAIVIGHDRYYQISFNHRQGFVKADDVDVLDF